jgi:glycosyltransferase involved in cell wall biosynthesis
MTCHGQIMPNVRAPTKGEWDRTDAIVAVSQETARQDAFLGAGDKLKVIYNGAHPAAPSLSRERIRERLELGDRPVGIIVARLVKAKGHGPLLHALSLLREQRLPVTLLVAGDGSERTDLERRALDLRLGPEWVRFLGYRTDVSELLAASDFFVLPSFTEGLPLSLLEAMLHRLPVVVTPVGGIPELVTDGQQGLYVDVDDPAALARAMERLLRNPALCRSLGDAGHRRVQAQFTFERMVAQYEALYYDLHRRRRTPGSEAMGK